jgi:hypothetical protein
MKNEVVSQQTKTDIALRSGLTVAVVTALLNAGYSYVEHIREPARWVREKD